MAQKKKRRNGTEEILAAIRDMEGRLNLRIDRLEQRLDRLEQRLDRIETTTHVIARKLLAPQELKDLGVPA